MILQHTIERATMDWAKIITIGAALALVAAVVQATFNIIDPPEPLEAIPGQWTQSGHSDRTSLSFTFWDDDEPPVIPEECDKCHSLYGYLDYLGVDDRTLDSSTSRPRLAVSSTATRATVRRLTSSPAWSSLEMWR